jgi:hypothetical protein
VDFRAPLLIQNRQIGPKLKQSLTGRLLTIYGINRAALKSVSSDNALSRSAAVVTGNSADFEATGVAIIDPF